VSIFPAPGNTYFSQETVMATVNLPPVIWGHEVRASSATPPDWLWQGLLARGNLTLLTSQWKAGKTTLLSMLLSRREHGGSLAGFAVQPGKTVVVTEEPLSLWAERARRYDFGSQVCFLSRPFLHVPNPDEWQGLLDQLLALRDQHNIDLAVIDPLAPYLRSENCPRSMLDTLLPLTALTRRGLSSLLLHHPGKGARLVGQAARGSTVVRHNVSCSVPYPRGHHVLPCFVP
jgi:AAA domain